MDIFLQLNGLTKRYDKHIAVNNVSLSIPKGQIYGLLGPNGAGKTSLIRMITGITIPDEGTILFDGKPWDRTHTQEMGYMPEERGLYKKMKVKDQITYLLELRGQSHAQAKKLASEWLEKLGLKEWRNKKANELSKGMQQKVQFIATMAHKPKLLILDEPFSGLDPVNTKVMEEEIHRMKDEGTTIIFSTHRMEQVEELCDFIALINKGELMLEDEIYRVRKQFQKELYHLEYSGASTALNQLNGVTLEHTGNGKADLRMQNGLSTKELHHKLADLPIEIHGFNKHLPRLNEIFIELVSKES
ncbi:MAG: ATP-binding cassette domain-containing protein [Bacteroidota bacterium]